MACELIFKQKLPSKAYEALQDQSPQNVPHGHADYLELKAIKTQPSQEKCLPLPLIPTEFS